jgi:serine O-acetyltransferase
MLDNIRADIARKKLWYRKDRGLRVNLAVALEPSTIAVIVYRYGSWVHRNAKNPVLRLLLKLPYWLVNLLVVATLHICISPRAEIGKGFVIHMFSGIFISDVIMGQNCTVLQGVSVGHLRHFRGKARPKKTTPPRIGNNVFLAAGCKIFGDVVIGNNVVVGANSLVIASVPDNCTVLGVPARIVSRNTRWLTEKPDVLEATTH